MKVIRDEPALVAGLVSAVLALVIAFGVGLSTGQVGAIMSVVSAALAVVVRSQVRPTSKGSPTTTTTGGTT